MNEERITYFAQTDARNTKVNFGIKAKDRTKHVYVIGKTGMGKSTLLENMAVQDIKNGEGLAFIDPHGKTAELLLEYVPEHRIKDVVYFAPFDTDYPISFNVLESVDPDKRHLVVSGLMSTFKKIWQDAWSARMEYILTNTLLALLEYPDATLLGVNRMLSDKVFRNQVVACVTDPSVKTFWTQEFANYTERMAAEAVPAIQNKIGQFTANALIRNMIGQPKSSFNIREMMDKGKIFIINLSKGRIGESNANLLGGMLITKIYLAALSRADVPDRVLKTLPNFYLFVDEFQSFANESFADILSEARKYKLNLTIAHQYIEQMEEEVRAAVFGNVGTMIVFRVGAYDAEVLEKEFSPVFTAEDIVNLGIFQIYLKLMIDGISSQPFSATTMPPIAKPEHSSVKEVIESSRAQFAHRRSDVEKGIEDWHAPIKPPVKPKPEMKTEIPRPIERQVEKLVEKPIPKPIEMPVQKPIEIKTPQHKPVSLSSLTPTKNNQKEVTPQRVNELKNALASVLGPHNIDKKIADAPKHKHINKEELKSNNQSEIPEDVLRDVLKVE
jgi:energy-coupling factor transporter ATP-binding protein EcfA2